MRRHRCLFMWVLAIAMIPLGSTGALALEFVQSKLVNTAPQIPYPGDWYSTQGALSGDTVVVGQRYDIADPATTNGVGGVKVFVCNALGSWAYQADLADVLAAGELVNAGEFGGGGLAIEGDTVLVGAYRNKVGTLTQAGNAFVFTRSGTTWTKQAELQSPTPAASSSFGLGADLSGDLAIVGQYGARKAHIFKRTGSAWSLVTTLLDPNTAGVFGYGVSIDGQVAAVGDHSSNDVTIFRYQPATDSWIQEQVLAGAAATLFGTKLDLQGDTLVVAARDTKVNNLTGAGAAHVYRYDGSQWALEQLIENPDPVAADQFGYNVALDGDTIIIGASQDDDGATNAGSAYIYRRTGTTWAQVAKLVASDPAAGKTLGEAVDISGTRFLLGGPGRSTSPAGNGDAYVVEVIPEPSSITLLAGALLGLLACRRRKTRTA